MVKHTKALRCKIQDSGKITILEKGSNMHTPVSLKPEEMIDFILKQYPNENVIIKTEKSASSMIFHGSKNKPFIRRGGRNPPIIDTTQWVYLIKNDGTVWTIDDKGLGKRFVGCKVQ